MSTKTCSKCNQEKSIKAKGLCNSCYTATCRENAKKAKLKETSEEKEEPNMKGLMILFYKQQEENATLRQKLASYENATSLDANSTGKDISVEPGLIKEVPTIPESIQKNLSHSFLQEVQTKRFEYDLDKYKEYFELIKQKKKWYGLGEDKLVELFPCFSLLVQKYNEKMFGKRSKWERDLMKDGKVESKSMIETKGRMVTSAGQFFLLLQKITSTSEVVLQDLFDCEKIRVYIQFLEELGREPCTIRNVLLTLKFIIKSFLGTETFQPHQKQMIQTSNFLDLECSLKKGQDFNKSRQNEEDLFENGHFMGEEEFSLLIMYLLERTQQLVKVENKTLDQLFELQDLCYSGMAMLDGGLRREVMCRLHVDSLIVKNGEYYLKKQTEKTNRGNSHEIPILEVSAYLFLLWKKERDALLNENSTSIVSLWINTNLKPSRPTMIVERLRKILKEFNPCLQMHKLDLRRLKISSLFQKREGDSTTPVELLDSQLHLVADYLNTSLNCIQNNYNRHKTQLKNALNILQPVSKEMNEAFDKFKDGSGSIVEEALKEAPKKMERYVRMSLDEEQHRIDFGEWWIKLEEFQKENPSCPSFEELYGKVIMKRKRVIGLGEDPNSKKNMLEVETVEVHDEMEIAIEFV
jgi:hypothetical protein